jgi:hypothetical protein
MRIRSAAFALLLALATTSRAHAQGSVFAFRGLGWAGRPVSARTAGTAGALAMFDPMMSLNPAALARWRSVAGWAVSAPSTTSYLGPTGAAEVKTVRFPLLGFAAVLPRQGVIGLSVSDYLDRTWTVIQRDSFVIRGDTEGFTDAGRSVGGVSDMALGVGYRLRDNLFVGFGLHYYLGSVRLAAQRVFDNTIYTDILEASATDFRGGGVSAGISASHGKLDFAASGRLNSRLRSANSSGSVVHTPLPAQLAFGLRLQPVPGVFLAGNAVWDGWGRANAVLTAGGGEQAQDVWALSVGADVQRVKLIKFSVPVRLGYRWRQLPFTSLGAPISEWAVSGGIGFSLARDRTSIDVAVESGSRSAGPATERFKSLFFALTVRP